MNSEVEEVPEVVPLEVEGAVMDAVVEVVVLGEERDLGHLVLDWP